MRVIGGKSLYLLIWNMDGRNEKIRVLDMRYLNVVDDKGRKGGGSFWGKHKVLKLR